MVPTITFWEGTVEGLGVVPELYFLAGTGSKRRRRYLELLQKCLHLQTRGNHVCSIHQVDSEIILNFCRIGTSVGREIRDFVSELSGP